MKIWVRDLRLEGTVYAIAFRNSSSRLDRDVVFYYSDSNRFGLGAASIDDVDFIDDRLGNEFKTIWDPDLRHFYVLWQHFTDVDELARVIDLDTDAVRRFEDRRLQYEGTRANGGSKSQPRDDNPSDG